MLLSHARDVLSLCCCPSCVVHAGLCQHCSGARALQVLALQRLAVQVKRLQPYFFREPGIEGVVKNAVSVACVADSVRTAILDRYTGFSPLPLPPV